MYQKIETLPIIIDLSQDPMFNKAIQQGLQQGIEKGRELEREEAKNTFIRNMIASKALTIQQIGDIADTTVAYVLTIQKSMKKKGE